MKYENNIKHKKLIHLVLISNILMMLLMSITISIIIIGGPRILDHAIKIDNKYALYVEIDKDLCKPKLVALEEKTEKYAKKHKDSIIINAGLFRVLTGQPNGQLIIDHKDLSQVNYMADDRGVALEDEECYPLIIDQGNLFILSHDKTDELNSRQNLTKYEGAVCGWGTLFENGRETNIVEKEIRWGKDKKARQIVGILKNKNYFVLTCEGAYYNSIINFLKTKDVEFAYSLDGGHSTKLIINGKMQNRFLFNLHGRPHVPNIIEFERQK